MSADVIKLIVLGGLLLFGGIVFLVAKGKDNSSNTKNQTNKNVSKKSDGGKTGKENAYKRNPSADVQKEDIPADLLTNSGSGLDPHISPMAAKIQVPRIADVRDISEEQLESLIIKNTEGRQYGILGEPRVNVLQLNMELDRLK